MLVFFGFPYPHPLLFLLLINNLLSTTPNPVFSFTDNVILAYSILRHANADNDRDSNVVSTPMNFGLEHISSSSGSRNHGDYNVSKTFLLGTSFK